MSLRWIVALPPGRKSPSIMRWPCNSRIRESANPPRRAWRTFAGSAPARRARVRASATAPMVSPTMTWLAALATWPVPVPPPWVTRLPRTSNTGPARWNAASVPPAMMVSAPASAPTVPPETGAST